VNHREGGSPFNLNIFAGILTSIHNALKPGSGSNKKAGNDIIAGLLFLDHYFTSTVL